MSSGGGGTSTNTVTQSDPWGGQQGYLLDIFQNAQKQFKGGGPQYYQGSTVAPPSNATTQGQNLITGAAPGAQASSDAANKALQFNLTDARDVNSNPYLKSAIDAAIQPAVHQFSDAGGTLSQLRDDSANTGTGYGYGSRGDIASGLAASRLNKDILGTTSAMAASGYQSGLDASSKALALAPGVIGASSQPGEMMSAVGQQQDQYQQALINDAVNRWNFEQNRPGDALARYQNLVGGTFGGQTSGVASGPQYQPNRVAQGAGAAMSAYALYSLLFA